MQRPYRSSEHGACTMAVSSCNYKSYEKHWIKKAFETQNQKELVVTKLQLLSVIHACSRQNILYPDVSLEDLKQKNF